jgi:hypothetical protein
MKRILLTLFLLIGIGKGYAQSTTEISGLVLDANSSEPLPHAYLFLKSYPEFSWLASTTGEFSLNFPEVLKDDVLVVSLLGYQRLEVPISNLDKFGNKIKLNQALIGLNEIVVKPDNSLKEMITKAIENIPENYPEKRHQLTGLYRKVSTDYEEFTHLVEASVVVEDVGYGKDEIDSRIKVESLRQSNELGEVDSALLVTLRRLDEHIATQVERVRAANHFVDAFEGNFVRWWFESKKKHYESFFFGSPMFPMYQELVGYELDGEDTVYQIAYGSTNPPTGNSYIKINSRNHAIVEAQYTPILNEDKTIPFQYFIKFKELEGKYYPEKVIRKIMRFINRDVGGHQMDVHTYWFDGVKTSKFKRIPYREAQKREQALEPKSYRFDSDFWEHYKSIKNHPLDAAIIKSLERDKSLDEQFRQNGKD